MNTQSKTNTTCEIENGPPLKKGGGGGGGGGSIVNGETWTGGSIFNGCKWIGGYLFRGAHFQSHTGMSALLSRTS